MPYSVAKFDGGYAVVTTKTGKKHSKKPLSKKRAQAQMRAIGTNSHGGK